MASADNLCKQLYLDQAQKNVDIVMPDLNSNYLTFSWFFLTKYFGKNSLHAGYFFMSLLSSADFFSFKINYFQKVKNNCKGYHPLSLAMKELNDQLSHNNNSSSYNSH